MGDIMTESMWLYPDESGSVVVSFYYYPEETGYHDGYHDSDIAHNSSNPAVTNVLIPVIVLAVLLIPCFALVCLCCRRRRRRRREDQASSTQDAERANNSRLTGATAAAAAASTTTAAAPRVPIQAVWRADTGIDAQGEAPPAYRPKALPGFSITVTDVAATAVELDNLEWRSSVSSVAPRREAAEAEAQAVAVAAPAPAPTTTSTRTTGNRNDASDTLPPEYEAAATGSSPAAPETSHSTTTTWTAAGAGCSPARCGSCAPPTAMMD